MQVTQVMKRCAELWKAVSEEELQRFNRLAELDRLRYEAEITAYQGPLHVPNKRRRKDPVLSKILLACFALSDRRASPGYCLYVSCRLRPNEELPRFCSGASSCGRSSVRSTQA
jgi:hypothetical protein